MRLAPLGFLIFLGLNLPSIGVFAQPAPKTPLLPLTDNAQAPYMGIYEGCVAPGIKGNQVYATGLNRTNVWGHDTLPFGKGSTWEHVSGKWQDWFYKPWSEWM